MYKIVTDRMTDSKFNELKSQSIFNFKVVNFEGNFLFREMFLIFSQIKIKIFIHFDCAKIMKKLWKNKCAKNSAKIV